MALDADNADPAERTAQLDRSQLAALDAKAPRRKISLVLYHRNGAETVELSERESVVVGRSEPSDVTIDDVNLSRQHARFSATEHGVWVEDLDSTNGTTVNGHPVVVTRVGPDDEISLGDVRAFIHVVGPRSHQRYGVETHDRFVGMLEDEVSRAKTFARSLAVLMVRSSPPGSSVELCYSRLRFHLRTIDKLGAYAPDTIEIALPEISEQRALELAREILDGRSPGEPELVMGLAFYGEHGSSAEELIDRARVAAQNASSQDPIRAAGHAPHAIPKTNIVIVSPKMRELYRTVQRVAKSPIPVLIHGETGTGKELVAQSIHEQGPRASKTMRSINCGAIPGTLVESMLFGHERGAFTGADRRSPGIFEQADGGTVFLDEIGELPKPAQAALLRVLETKTLTRIGGTEEINVDVRVVAATNRNLDREVREGRFREDLLFRLNTLTLQIPPLRERVDEIAPLARRFMEDASKINGAYVGDIEPTALALLTTYAWPGNVRELRNVIERAVVIAKSPTIGVDELSERVRGSAREEEREEPPLGEDEPADFKTRVRRFETRLIVQALSRCGWNQSEAARYLKMPLRTLTSKLQTYGLREQRKSDPDDE